MVVYIITWRGLSALLILGKRQCEGLNARMGRSSYSYAFLFPQIIMNINR